MALTRRFPLGLIVAVALAGAGIVAVPKVAHACQQACVTGTVTVPGSNPGSPGSGSSGSPSSGCSSGCLSSPAQCAPNPAVIGPGPGQFCCQWPGRPPCNGAAQPPSVTSLNLTPVFTQLQAQVQPGTIQLDDPATGRPLQSNSTFVVGRTVHGCLNAGSNVPAPGTTTTLTNQTTVQGWTVQVKITITAGQITWDWQNGQPAVTGSAACDTASYPQVSGEPNIGSSSPPAPAKGDVSISVTQNVTLSTFAQVLSGGLPVAPGWQAAGSCATPCTVPVGPPPSQWHEVVQIEGIGVS